MMDITKLSKPELLAYIERQASNNASGLLFKVTDKGGIYIRHDSFKEYSSTKSKDYIAGINIGYSTAKALFNNPALLDAIRESVNTIK
jgi:hypothetical protein